MGDFRAIGSQEESFMETLEIRSKHDLTTRPPADRKPGNHSYQLNCRQFLTLQRDWQRKREEHDQNLVFMTLNFERIWISPAEAREVESAILAKRPMLELG